MIVDSARAVQDCIAVFAEQVGILRYDVGMGLKQAVRHAAQ
ncbi:hypothetical protein [Streptomyces sp. NPDC056707]